MQARIKILFHSQEPDCYIVDIGAGRTGDNQPASLFKRVESVVVFQEPHRH